MIQNSKESSSEGIQNVHVNDKTNDRRPLALRLEGREDSPVSAASSSNSPSPGTPIGWAKINLSLMQRAMGKKYKPEENNHSGDVGGCEGHDVKGGTCEAFYYDVSKRRLERFQLLFARLVKLKTGTDTVGSPVKLCLADVEKDVMEMVRILQEEDHFHCASGDPFLHDQPCLEFVLKERVLKVLCECGINDHPKGMMALVLHAIGQLLGCLNHSIIPFQNVHESMVQIINSAVQYHPVVTPGTKHSTSSTEEYIRMTEKALVGLLVALWRKIRDDPSQLAFFYVPLDETGHPSLNIASSLLPIVLKAGEVGEQARRATLLAVTARGGLVPSFFSHHSPFFFNMLNMLESQVYVLLQGKGNALQEEMDLNELLRFLSAITSESLYKVQTGSNSDLRANIHEYLAGTQDNSHNLALGLSIGLKRILDEHVKPAILQNEDKDCLIAGVILLNRMLSIFMCGSVDGNKKTCLCTTVLSFIGSDKDVEGSIRQALLRCIKLPTASSGPAVTVLQLLGTVLECQIGCSHVQRFVFGREASHCLIAPPSNSSSSIRNHVGLAEPLISSSIVETLADWDFIPSGTPTDCYLREAIRKHVRRCAQKIQMHRNGSARRPDSYAVGNDTESDVVAQNNGCLTTSQENTTWDDLYLTYLVPIDSLCRGPNSFLSSVVERVKGLHDSSVEENIALSGVISNMVAEAAIADTSNCCWINRMLVLYLFHKKEPSSLYSAISLTWHEGMDRLAVEQKGKEHLLALHKVLGVLPGESTTSPFTDLSALSVKALESQVVLEEIVKEIRAILLARTAIDTFRACTPKQNIENVCEEVGSSQQSSLDSSNTTNSYQQGDGGIAELIQSTEREAQLYGLTLGY